MAEIKQEQDANTLYYAYFCDLDGDTLDDIIVIEIAGHNGNNDIVIELGRTDESGNRYFMYSFYALKVEYFSYGAVTEGNELVESRIYYE